ncbi:anthranilate synthase component I family protein [Euzebya rosea]|uniref:anthranilate synthase component I family protein n=1 Tax=Euzebya rosea TaxID=2052804 RepID=UPI001300BE8C|nr:anthranilate synthase component I family protein [Euzebya rosea]
MTVLRPYTGPDPGHPVTVVPSDPSRHGALVRVRGWEVAVADPVDAVTDGRALDRAADMLGWAGPAAEGPPFTHGLLGFVTDDASAALLDLDTVDERPAPAPLPPLWFGRYTHAACQSPDGRWWVTGESAADADRAHMLLSTAAARGRVPARSRAERTDGPVPARTTLSRAQHGAAVARIQDWIADGDVYQVNLTLHVGARWDGSPRALARRLFGASPSADHAAFVHAPGATIASVSPETFLRMDGRRATIRPIKGTRRRAEDPVVDRALAEDLRTATKDGAEHVMIVDLERNDLGRICEVGSVRVPQLMELEAHPTVWHLTSTVLGTVRADLGLRDVLTALFPCGSVTGAPKRMAVARTRLVEPWRRGVYCGAIGVVAPGLVDLSVAIRTAVLHDGWAWYGTGGGIVVDSDRDAEWEEAMTKAAAFFTATGTAPPSG